jgi:hypothetical protein
VDERLVGQRPRLLHHGQRAVEVVKNEVVGAACAG